MFNARVFFTASVMTLFLYPMAAMAADVSPPTSGADAEGNLPNVTVTLCSGQSDGYSWTSKKNGNTYVCQKGVPVLKGSDVKPKPCTALDGSCGGFQTDKKGDGGSGNGKGSGGDGNGKGSGGGKGGGSGSGGGSSGTGSGSGSGSGGGSGGTGSGSGSGDGSGGAGSGSANGSGMQMSGGAGSGDSGGAGSSSGATSGNDAGSGAGSAGGGVPSVDNTEYLKALREWGVRWAEFFKGLTLSEQAVRTNLTSSLAFCVRAYGASQLGKDFSESAIKSADKEMQEIEKKRQAGIERAAKEKAAIDATRPKPSPAVPMPDAGGGAGAGGGNNVTNNNTTNNNTTNNITNITNNNTTNNNSSGAGGKSGGNGNGGSGQTGNNMGNGSGDEDGKGKGDGLSEYCAKNPDALACQKMGKMSDVKFPDSDAENHLDKGLKDFKSSLKEKGKVASEGFAYKYKNFLSRGDTAACPPPITFEAFGVKGAFKYDWLCQSMEMARGLVIAAFALFTAFFVVKNLK